MLSRPGKYCQSKGKCHQLNAKVFKICCLNVKNIVKVEEKCYPGEEKCY